MLLTDYLKYPKDSTWDIARQCGVEHGTIRLPEDGKFDYCDETHWKKIHGDYCAYGLKPIIVEPMPYELHDHIKAGDEKRDECIEKVIKMLPVMDKLDIRTICFNWMAHVGWYRSSADIPERGGALVTGFDMSKYVPTEHSITEKQLWDNYEYFVKAVVPHAEKHGIKLALHPDDPPRKLGNVSRIMVNYNNIRKAVYDICSSPSLGVTMCQANFHIMGEDLMKIIPEMRDKIFFVHFRNTTGNIDKFRETFHDNGDLPMAELIRVYHENGIDVPVRVDHVPTMLGENSVNQGYDALGRFFAIGYLKGILEAVCGK